VDLGRALHVTLVQVADLLDLHTGWIWLLQNGESYLAAALNLPPARRTTSSHGRDVPLPGYISQRGSGRGC
jgi:hypothetical protein